MAGISTFPAPDEKPSRFRVLFLSCVGGHEARDEARLARLFPFLGRLDALAPDLGFADVTASLPAATQARSSEAEPGRRRPALFLMMSRIMPI